MFIIRSQNSQGIDLINEKTENNSMEEKYLYVAAHER